MSASVAPLPSPAVEPSSPPLRTLEQIKADIVGLNEDDLGELFDWVWRLQGSEPSGISEAEARAMIAQADADLAAGRVKSMDQLFEDLRKCPTE